jgi:hypothetical protein
VPPEHSDKALSYLERQADALYRQGDEKGDNAALKQSIEVWRLVLVQRERALDPLDWAMTQNNLGIALARLVERESSTVHLSEAVAAYRAALQERPRARVPLDWAGTNNLGKAPEMLSERENTSTRRTTNCPTRYSSALTKFLSLEK